LKELIPNAGEHNVAKRVGSLTETMVQRLPANPGPTEMRTVASVRQVNNLIETKAIQEIAVADGGGSFIIFDASVPTGNTQVHHTAPRHIIARLQQLGYPSLDLDGCPAMVLDQIDHVGIQPWTADALHTQMNSWNGGVLFWENVQNNNNAQQLVDELIGFYQSKCPGWEKGIRGWANVNGLPYTP